MLPSKIRTKIVNINGKELKLNPWLNLTLTEFEDIYNYNSSFSIIDEYLITPFVESKSKLTLTEKRYALVELYKLSVSNNLDIQYTCKHCESKSSYNLKIDDVVTVQPLKERVIKTDNYIFNLKPNSTYCIDINADNMNFEALLYIASFIDSIETEDDTFIEPNINDLAKWLNTDLESKDFKELYSKFEEIQPTFDIKAKAICEYCSEVTDLSFKGIEHFLV